MTKRIVWLDCDGVLANFDQGFVELTGVDPNAYEQLHGSTAFWETISNADSFFERLPCMPDAHTLYNAIAHERPIILTGTPLGDWSIIQKLRWRDAHFPGVPMVTCRAKDKAAYCKPGDVLIDDRTAYAALWERAGGTFIHHTSAVNSLNALFNCYYHWVVIQGVKWYLGYDWHLGYEHLYADKACAAHFEHDTAFDVSAWVGKHVIQLQGTEPVWST